MTPVSASGVPTNAVDMHHASMTAWEITATTANGTSAAVRVRNYAIALINQFVHHEKDALGHTIDGYEKFKEVPMSITRSAKIAAISLPLVALSCQNESPVKEQMDLQDASALRGAAVLFAERKSAVVEDFMEKHNLPQQVDESFFEKGLHNDFISKAENLLQSPEVQSSRELSMFLNKQLGIMYYTRPVGNYQQARECLERARSLALAERDIYRLDLAAICFFLSKVYSILGETDRLLEIYKLTIQDCQQVGSGKANNVLATQSVLKYHREMLRQGRLDEAIVYLEWVEQSYEQEMRHAAQSALYDLYFEKGDKDKKQMYLRKLKESPGTWEYKHISDPVIRIVEEKAKHRETTEQK